MTNIFRVLLVQCSYAGYNTFKIQRPPWVELETLTEKFWPPLRVFLMFRIAIVWTHLRWQFNSPWLLLHAPQTNQTNILLDEKDSPLLLFNKTRVLNYCTYTNHLGVSPRALYCVVDSSYGLGRSLGHCRPALPKGREYQMVKTQTQNHVRRPVVWTNWWQIWVFFSSEFLRGTAGICHTRLWGLSKAL